MIRRWAAVAVGVIALTAACGVEAGTVTAKAYDPPRTDIHCMPIGNNPCFPMVQPVPECWRLDLSGGDQAGSVCVDHEVWERVQPGDRYPT